MARVTTEEVRVIIVTDVDDLDITAFIKMANTYLNGLTWKSTVTEAILIDVETWLSAHLIAVSRDRTTIKEKVGEAQVDYVNEFDQGLKASPYGQMAIILDPSGTLLDLADSKKQATIQAVNQFE